jgi:choline dehydrogenase-like flavoprotein
MMNKAIDTDVLIVGAGPVGLFLANECARRGLRWLLVEARSSQSEHSKALAIFPRTIEIISDDGRKPLSIADRVAAPAEERAKAYATFMADCSRSSIKKDDLLRRAQESVLFCDSNKRRVGLSQAPQKSLSPLRMVPWQRGPEGVKPPFALASARKRRLVLCLAEPPRQAMVYTASHDRRKNGTS